MHALSSWEGPVENFSISSKVHSAHCVMPNLFHIDKFFKEYLYKVDSIAHAWLRTEQM